jgi:hypothetical protein
MSEHDDNNHAERILGIVASCLEERGMKFGRCPVAPAVLFLCHTKSAIHSCVISVRESRALLRCMLYVACRVPPEKRAAAAELFTRINYGLPLGTFEMDFSDGEICYRTGIDVTGGDLASEMVTSLIAATVGTVDRYYPAIMSFLWSDMAPEDAVAMVEESPKE